MEKFDISKVNIEVHDVVGSTNDLAKEMPLNKLPCAIIADKQTAGRGRLGRRFESPAGTGLYISFAFEPGYDVDSSLFVTMAAAVGTMRAIKNASGIETSIKWVNDLFLSGKKVCGILTEAVAAKTGRGDGAETARPNGSSGVERIVVGIGINCYPGSFPPELKDIAGSLFENEDPDDKLTGEKAISEALLADDDNAGDEDRASEKAFSRDALAKEMIKEVLPLIADPERSEFLDEYRKNCFILGKDILIHRTYGDTGEPATATGIDDDGGLIVKHIGGENAGREEVLRTGEISISTE